MALVGGERKKKADFFKVTKTAIARGFLFLTGDKPNNKTFRNLIESSTFPSESEDRAKEEDNISQLKDLQGLVIGANDSQVISRKSKSQVKTWAVQPSQVTEVGEDVSDTKIGEGDNAFQGNITSVSRDTSISTHNKYLVNFSSSFTTWLSGFYNQVQTFIETITPRLLPTGGEVGQGLIKVSEDDYDVTWGDLADGVTPPPDPIITSSGIVFRTAVSTDGINYTITSPEGEELTSLPDTLAVNFNMLNTGNVSLTIDGLASTGVFNILQPLLSGELVIGMFIILTKNTNNTYSYIAPLTTGSVLGSGGNIPSTNVIAIPGFISWDGNSKNRQSVTFSLNSSMGGLASGDGTAIVAPWDGILHRLSVSASVVSMSSVTQKFAIRGQIAGLEKTEITSSGSNFENFLTPPFTSIEQRFNTANANTNVFAQNDLIRIVLGPNDQSSSSILINDIQGFSCILYIEKT